MLLNLDSYWRNRFPVNLAHGQKELKSVPLSGMVNVSWLSTAPRGVLLPQVYPVSLALRMSNRLVGTHCNMEFTN